MSEPTVIVELFGIVRQRAGTAEVAAHGGTIGELLQSVGRVCPKLDDLFAADGSLSRRYLVAIDGERFTLDPTESIPVGARVLILGADAGG